MELRLLARTGTHTHIPQVDDDEETECQPSRVLYCVIMAFASAYAAMAMTAWATSSG